MYYSKSSRFSAFCFVTTGRRVDVDNSSIKNKYILCLSGSSI